MPRNSAERPSTDADDRVARARNNEDRDERLRLTGDARYVEVAWSRRDAPYWPLPKR